MEVEAMIDSDKIERVLLVTTIVLVIMTSGVIIAVNLNYSAQQLLTEYVGRASTSSWVPIMVIRNPPGDECSTTVSVNNRNEMTLRFESITVGVNMTGEYTGEMLTDIYSTAENLHADVVVAKLLNQIWDVWRLRKGGEEWHEMTLVNTTDANELAVLSAEFVNERDIWVAGPPRAWGAINFGISGGIGHQSFQYTGNKFTYIRAGYSLCLLNISFEIRILLNMRRSTLVTNCSLTGNVGVRSNDRFEFVDLHIYRCLGMLIWFEPWEMAGQ